MRSALLATAFALLPVLAAFAALPATAAMERYATIEGRLVMLSAHSLGVLDEASGKVVHFMLEAPFDEVYRPDEKTLVPITDVRMNSPVRVFYDQARGGPRRAERIIVLKHR